MPGSSMPSNAVCPSTEMRAHTCSFALKVIDTGPSFDGAAVNCSEVGTVPIESGTLFDSPGAGDCPAEDNAEIIRNKPSTNNTTAPTTSNHVGMPPLDLA